MTKKLFISDELSLPIDAITQTFGILAVRGAGKTNTAAVMAEEMFEAHLPFVVIDPVGAWYGLRSSAGGRAGLAIPIFGGRHGDVPLERTGGQLLADLIVEKRLTCVIDCSEFSEGDKVKFLIDFAERLYRKNTQPLHLFLEEADDFIPQQPRHEQARLLGAWQNIVRRGRARGLGITMITQRSAVLNKSVLTQIETLIVLRTTSPQDRGAIKAWVDYQGGSQKMLETLPGLGNGEAWVWSPSWLKCFERVRIRKRTTYDSGATPTGKSSRLPGATLADVDLGAIREAMTDTIERAKADDPRELRKRVAELERASADLQKKLAAAEASVKAKPVKPGKPLVAAGQLKKLEALVDRARELAGDIEKTAKRVGFAASANGELGAPRAMAEGVRLPPRMLVTRWTSSAGVKGVPRPAATKGNGGLPGGVGRGGLRRILVALAQRGGGLTNRQIGVRAGLSSKSGTFATYMSQARSAAWVVDHGELRVITAEGVKALGHYEPLPTGQALQEHWLGNLGSSGAARILRALCEAYPRALSNEEIGQAADLSNVSGTFATYMSKLRTLELVTGSRGETRASEELFD